MTREEIYIEKLSELRSKYSCFDEKEEPFYHALSLGIKGIKALEQEPCTDAISREAVLAIFNEWFSTCNIADKRESPRTKINALPPVTPKPRTGKWIITSFTDRYICSECGHDLITQYKPDNYCSYCGAKMIFDRTDDIISCEEI